MDACAPALPADARRSLLARLRARAADRLVPRPARHRQRARRRDRRLRADRDPERAPAADRRRAAPALHADRRLRARARARRADAAAHVADQRPRDPRRLVLVGAPDRADRLGRDDRPRGDLRDERRRHVHDPGDPADREAGRRPGAHRRPGDPLPRDRRARAARAAAGDARRERAGDGELGGAGDAPPRRVGDRLLVADGREPDRDPARLERRRPRVPLGRQADRAGLRLLRAGRLRRDRSPARERQGPAAGTAARAGATCSRARPTT